MHSTQNGLIFLPLTYELEIPLQLLGLDAVLHKATDEIVSIELTDASTVGPRITYTHGLQELRRYLLQFSTLSCRWLYFLLSVGWTIIPCCLYGNKLLEAVSRIMLVVFRDYQA